MALDNYLIILIYCFTGLLMFSIGFYLAYSNLKKVNTVESEKFDLGDATAMIGFGSLFALATLLMLSLTFEVIELASIPQIVAVIILIMMGILIVYPLWEVFFLGKPTSDSVHDFHKFLESKILDRFQGNIAYFVSFLIFIVIYIIPIFLISHFANLEFFQVSFMWFLVFPLFFLSYFAASGTVSGIIGATYTNTIEPSIRQKSGTGQTKTKLWLSYVMVAIAWIPFFLNLITFFGPILKTINGGVIVSKGELKGDWMPYLSLFTATVFGVKGFFSKFWSKKSKTKTIDFLFSGYLMIGIGVNMLIAFIQIDYLAVERVFQSVPLLEPLLEVFTTNEIVLPLIVVQSFITFVYGIINLVQVNTDFYSDIQLQTTSKAFGVIDLDKLIEKREDLLKEMEEERNEKGEKGKKKKVKPEKYNFVVLYKSLMRPPSYSSYGVDLNEQLRKKSAQYLFLISTRDKEVAQNIVDFVFAYSIDRTDEELADNNENKQIYLSKEAFDLLGEIGTYYPEMVMGRMINALETDDVYIQQYLLDALGDIGESKENMKEILDKITHLFTNSRYEVRQASFKSMTEMILEGDTSDKEFVQLALNSVYKVLEDQDNSDSIDTCFEALVAMSARIADDIDIEKIIPFIYYNKGDDKDTINYIVQNAITVLSYAVYYNIERFGSLIGELKPFLEDKREFIRYVTADALGNYILKGPQNHIDAILADLMKISIHDEDDDVTFMATESIAEFLILHEGYQATINGEKIKILDYYTKALLSTDRIVAENASEALKQISPLYDDDITPLLDPHIRAQSNLELVRDCLHIIAVSGKEEHESTDLELVYQLTKHEDPSVRSEAVLTLGYLIVNRPEIDPNVIVECLSDSDPQVRNEAIFALGKIGKIKPQEVVPILIEKFYQLDRTSEELVSEVELYAESLGVIGSVHPSNEIIVTLQNVLMGDTNPFAKDVIARALGAIGHGMIESGKAIRRIESKSFYNQISWFNVVGKAEYTIGNLIIIFIEALQLKGIPDSVMNEISDSIQDLLPVFLFAKTGDEDNDKILNIVKELLSQAYYANYNSEILETMDRIDSLLTFKRYFMTDDTVLKDQFLFYTKQYTPDGKQFFDQGEVFMTLSKEDKKYLEYALLSFEISRDLTRYEYYTPDAILQTGLIYKGLGNLEKAKENLEDALEIFTSMDDVDKMKEVDAYLDEMK